MLETIISLFCSLTEYAHQCDFKVCCSRWVPATHKVKPNPSQLPANKALVRYWQKEYFDKLCFTCLETVSGNMFVQIGDPFLFLKTLYLETIENTYDMAGGSISIWSFNDSWRNTVFNWLESSLLIIVKRDNKINEWKNRKRVPSPTRSVSKKRQPLPAANKTAVKDYYFQMPSFSSLYTIQTNYADYVFEWVDNEILNVLNWKYQDFYPTRWEKRNGEKWNQ